MGDQELGYCQVGSSVVKTTKAICVEISGSEENWTEEEPGCVIGTAAFGSVDHEDVASMSRLHGLVVDRDVTAARLWMSYAPVYHEMAAPIVDLMGRDPVARQLVLTMVVEPALQSFRTMAVHLDPNSDDAMVRDCVRAGVERLASNVMALGGENGAQLVQSALAALREVQMAPVVGANQPTVGEGRT